jgi:hypothetical protein
VGLVITTVVTGVIGLVGTGTGPGGGAGAGTGAGTGGSGPVSSGALWSADPAPARSPSATPSGVVPASGIPSSAGAGADPKVVPPPADQPWDDQLGGAYRPAAGVAVVTRDRTDPPLSGAYNICYLDAFQSRPGASADWPGLLLRDAAGRPVKDPGRPGEYLLDTGTAAARDAIAARLRGWLAGCARAGYQAVEPAGLDSWTRSHGLLTAADNVALARQVVVAAHALGLAVAQQNAAELLPDARTRIGFDFAVVEECRQQGGCAAFLSAYGDLVFEVEYSDRGLAGFRAACRARGNRISITYRDRQLRTPGYPGYAFRTC